MKVVMRIISGPLEGKEFKLDEGEYTIGRSPASNIVIDDLRVSGNHLRLTLKSNTVKITDLGSSNGTFIGNIKVTAPTLLELPARFQIGDSVIEIKPEASEITPPKPKQQDAIPREAPSKSDIINESFIGIADLKDDPKSKTYIHIGKTKVNWKKTLFWMIAIGFIFIGGCIRACNYVQDLSNPNVTAPLIFATIIALLPFVPYALLIRMLDFNHRIKLSLFIVTLMWGGFFAIGFAGTINTLFLDITGSREFLVSIFAPWFEETMKGLALAVIFVLLYDEFESTIDGIVFGMAVGLGFAIMENINYFARAMMGAYDFGFTVVIRSTLLPTICHPSWTAFTGFGFGLARESKKGCLRYIWPIIGYCAAVCTHAMWNGAQNLITTGDPTLDLFWKIIFVGFFVVVVMSSAYLWGFFRERRVVSKYLKDIADTSIVTPEEYKYLIAWFGNIRFKMHCLSTDGISGYFKGSKIHRAQVRLAFRRWHLDQGDRFKGVTMDRIERDLIAEIKNTRKKA